MYHLSNRHLVLQTPLLNSLFDLLQRNLRNSLSNIQRLSRLNIRQSSLQCNHFRSLFDVLLTYPLPNQADNPCRTQLFSQVESLLGNHRLNQYASHRGSQNVRLVSSLVCVRRETPLTNHQSNRHESPLNNHQCSPQSNPGEDHQNFLVLNQF